MIADSKIKLLKKSSFLKFLIVVLLTILIIPAPPSDPDDDFNQASGQYQAITTNQSLYSTIRKHGISRDYNDQFFSDSFLFDRFQLLSFNVIILFTEQFVVSKLLSYNLISLPPPYLA